MKIYHNSRCSKSRETLALLEKSGVLFETIEYLKHPPTKEDLEEIVEKLGVSLIDIIRTNEDIWKEKYKDKELSGSELLEAIVQNPILLQRPIVVSDDNAIIGRPPEKVFELLG